MSSPEIAVVVPSHDRPLRLRWLLNALEDQTLDRRRWEVVVAHDSSEPATRALLESHPLAKAGILRHVRLPAASAPPGANRNAGWQAARAPLIAFTDDDCRPPSDWLERALEAGLRNPGAIVQGTTRPDPEEWNLFHAPHCHTQWITPPVPFAQACNILYPRAVLETMGGFDEELFTGEDTELWVRAQDAGVPYVGAPEMLTFHAILPQLLTTQLRSVWRWQDLPRVIKRHPSLRRHFPLWIFWKRTHVWMPAAVAAAILSWRSPLYGVLAVPYLVHAVPHHGVHPRNRFAGLAQLPGRVAIDATEFAALARGSFRHRTLFL